MDENEYRERQAAYMATIEETVEKFGLAIQGVFYGENDPNPGPNFAYSVGLAAKGLPELIVFGLPMKVAQSLLNDLGLRMLRGEVTVAAGDTVHNLVADYPVRLLNVVDSWEHLTVANALYGNPDGCLPALQLVFPDPDRRWPWWMDSSVAVTPLLGPVADSKTDIVLAEAADV